jgi:hypothetical protein
MIITGGAVLPAPAPAPLTARQALHVVPAQDKERVKGGTMARDISFYRVGCAITLKK